MAMDLEHNTLFNELTQGKELAEQLRNHLSSSSHQTRQSLIDQILSSYEKALSSLNWAYLGSSMSEFSDKKQVFKKRKSSRKRDEQVNDCSGSSLEGSLDDGFSWRKYCQKDILGTNYPRGYFRCTHRHSQGCLATKQVQRSDNDPTIFDVTYRGRHTCKRTSPSEIIIKENFMENNNNHLQQCEEKQNQPQEILLSFGAGSNVRNESGENIFSSFFPFFQNVTGRDEQ